MMDEKDKHSIIEIAVKYGIKKVYLFGSALYTDYAKVNDIDIGIVGIKSGSYFNFVTDVSDQVSKNIDVIDMEFNPKFAYFIEKEGTVIYG
ncbi:MAG: nucleotidyltransferase domain-containing protein [bacterium]|nr:nucleotidyltransferase domain-containing protein [bacterium]